FFSSRRRHTRWRRDWSSDVWSSDLDNAAAVDASVHSRILLHLPKSYQARAHFIPLSGLKIGQDAAVHARVYRSRVIQTRTRGRILDVILTDGSSFVHAKWFHGAYLQTREFSAGREVVLFGRVDFDR